MSRQKTIIFCGGGSGGHVIPALTLIKEIRQTQNWKIDYLGSYEGIERELVTQFPLPYRALSTGKLRRYGSWKNIGDLFKIFKGLIQAFFYLLPYSRKDCLIFSFGGFVSVPVVVAAWLQRKCIYLHEQTTRMGLANQIASPLARRIFVSFEDSLAYFSFPHKLVYTGYPVRKECFLPKKEDFFLKGKKMNSFHRPLLFVTGGGNGSKLINELIRDNLSWLKENFYIFHQVGKAFEEEYAVFNDDSYTCVAFFKENMIDLLKGAQVVVSRSGAGIVAELLACRKRSLFIPLKNAQKNEQLHNAKEAEKKLGSLILEEDQLNQKNFRKSIEILSQSSSKPAPYSFKNGTAEIMSLLLKAPPLKSEKSVS